jgi:PAS domain S-box-containing protein
VVDHDDSEPVDAHAAPITAGRSTVAEPSALGALDLLSTGIAMVASDGTITFVNRAWSTLFSARGDCIGRQLWHLFPHVVRGAEGNVIEQTLRDGVPRTAQVPFRHGLYELRVARSSRGTALVEVRDWTRVARLERQHDRLLESITDGLCLIDEQWRFAYWNVAAERMTGVPREELIGKPVREAFLNIAGTPVENALRETIRSRSARQVHRWRYGGDAQGRAAGIYDAFSYAIEGGGLLLIFREVSDWVTQEHELAERSAETKALRRLAKAMAEENDFAALLRMLCEDALEQCAANGAAVVQLNESHGEIVATAGNTDVLRGTRFPLDGSLTELAVLRRSVVSEREYPPEHPVHQRLAAMRQAGPVLVAPLIAHDRVLGVLTVSRNAGSAPFDERDNDRLQAIADHASLGLWKLRLLDEARAASQAKSDFIATMSHELRTPLAALTGYGELLAEEIVGRLSEQQADVVDRMRSVTHHLAVVIDEILTFSNLEAGRETPRVEWVDVEALVRSVVAVVEPLAREKGIAFSVDVPGDLHTVTDPDKVRQILVNLVGNGIKFTDRGEVKLSVNRNDPRISFRVTDTGIGIHPADRDRLFQPFTQLESGLTRRHGGTGLGLFISRRLAEMVGGRIEMESEPGRGSVFTFEIPTSVGAPGA